MAHADLNVFRLHDDASPGLKFPPGAFAVNSKSAVRLTEALLSHGAVYGLPRREISNPDPSGGDQRMRDFFDVLSELDSPGGNRSQREKSIWTTFGCRRAVLVMDSTGFTRVTETLGILHYLTLLLKIRRTVTRVFETHGSIRTRAIADNMFAEFSTVEEALAAALAANRAIHEQQVMITETEPFTLCIGIGYGDLLDAGEEGLFGDEMNVASKLGEDVAEGREILLTDAAFSALPVGRGPEFEERHAGFSGNSLRYHWTHWSP